MCCVVQGKSLSLICSTLTWLRDRIKRDEEESAAATAAPAPTSSQGSSRGESSTPSRAAILTWHLVKATRFIHSLLRLSSCAARGEEPAWLRDYGVAQKQKEAERRQRLRLERQARLRQRIEQARARPLQEAAAALLMRKDDEDDKAKKTKAQAAAKRRKVSAVAGGWGRGCLIR